jgi:6-phosphogluconolactonase
VYPSGRKAVAQSRTRDLGPRSAHPAGHETARCYLRWSMTTPRALKSLLLLIVSSACGGGSSTIVDASSQDARMVDAAAPAKLVAYVSGAGPDITWYGVDSNTGSLSKVSSIASFAANPSFLAIAPGASHLYAISEANDRVGAYAIDPATGALTFINDTSSGGDGPAHLSVDPGGKYVLVANYGNGAISVLPIRGDGGVGAAQQTINAGVRAHMILTDPANRFVFVPCLGSNYIAQYVFDAGTGQLTPNAVPTVPTASGAGPRHLAFSPDVAHAYLINELDSTLTALAYNATTGRLTPIHTLTTRAPGATGTNTTAEVWVHPSGKFVYGSNRGDNTIAVFARDAQTGRLTPIAQTSTQGMTPRDFTLDPTGRFLYAANQNSSSLVTFSIDPTAGTLTPIGSPITVTSPTFVGFVALP